MRIEAVGKALPFRGAFIEAGLFKNAISVEIPPILGLRKGYLYPAFRYLYLREFLKISKIRCTENGVPGAAVSVLSAFSDDDKMRLKHSET